MPKLNGIDVAARAQKLERAPRIIILSMHSDESYIIRALAAGARAYLLKDATDEDLLPAVRAVAAGKPVLQPGGDRGARRRLRPTLQTRGLTDSYHLLTDREKEVLQLLAEGRSNKEVATRAGSQPLDRRDPSREPDAEAEPAQHGGGRALRRSQGHHRLSRSVSRYPFPVSRFPFPFPGSPEGLRYI